MRKKEFLKLNSQSIIGMVHCLPLPGTPNFNGDFKKIIDRAVEDALTLEKAGVDAVIVENMGDSPFGVKLSTAQIAALSMATMAVKNSIKIPVGVDAAFNDYEASISIAASAGATFVRIPVFVDTVIFTDGIIYPAARNCMLYRKNLGVENIKILADVQVKHSHMLIPNIKVEQSAKDAADNGADAIIITGSSIGQETPIEMIEKVKKIVSIPVIAGSGVNCSNIKNQMNIADGAIIGSSLKIDGILSNPISYELTKKLIDELY